ncbi:MAG: TolC family protein, partial [Gemmatimonadales bacterium]
ESLEETRALNRAGLASDYDVLRLEVELANLEPQLRRAINQARAQERELRTDLNLPDDTRMRVVGSLAGMELEALAENRPENRAILERFGVPPPSPDDADAVAELRSRVTERSSALRQLDLDAELKLAELRVEQAEYLPRISLFGNYQVQAQQDGRPEFFASSGLRGYGRVVGIQVTMPIFTGRQRSARIEQKSAALDGARVQRERIGDELGDQLVSLLELVDEARLRARGQRLAVEQAGRGYEIASAQYREGLGSQLELTDAEVALRQSEFNYAEAVHDYLSARARLDELTGEVPIP